jgi:hypothetical protein
LALGDAVMTDATRISIPKDIPFRAVAAAMASLGLIHDARVHPDGVSRWVRAPREWMGAPKQRCEVADCGQAAAVRVGAERLCCTHYLSAVRNKGLV